MKLSLVVPCYNEAANLVPFYKEVVNAFSGSIEDYEIIFVNDGSNDKTDDVIDRLLSGPVAVKKISFSRNFGKEAAMLAGMENSGGDFITIIDADLQQNPAVVVEMINILKNDNSIDCVAAYQEERKESKVMTVVKDSFYKLINKFSDTEFYNGASDFRTFRRQMADEIINLKEKDRFSKGLFSWVGFSTKYIPYTVDERLSGTSKWNFKKLLKYAVNGIESFTTTPLKIPYIIGIIFIVISLPVFISECTKDASKATSAVYFVGGTILLCLGIIGDYLAKINIQSKDRPIYIIKENKSNR